MCSVPPSVYSYRIYRHTITIHTESTGPVRLEAHDHSVASTLPVMDGGVVARLRRADASLSDADAHQGARQRSDRERRAAQQRVSDDRGASPCGADRGARNVATGTLAGTHRLRRDRR